MDTFDLLRALRRRWLVVVATVAVALVAAWLSMVLAPPGEGPSTYRATTVLHSTSPGELGSGPNSLRTVAALAVVGEVPRRVAAAIQHQGDPRELARKVDATGFQETGILRITVTSRSRDEAKLLADTFADQLVTFLNEGAAQEAAQEAESLQSQMATLEGEIAGLNRDIGPDDTDPGDQLLVAQRDAKLRRYGFLFDRYQQLIAQDTSAGLQVIEPARPRAVGEGGFLQFRTVPSRLALAVVLGLLGGIGLVILRERLDTRIHSKESAERHFEFPVLAEIPFVRAWRRRSGIAVAGSPKSAAADSFRLLAAGITRRPPAPPQTIMVTGPGPGEGKSTVVANLAAAFAEVGKKVLVLSCDLHRPTIHNMFGISNTVGLADALREERDDYTIIDGDRWRTMLPNIRLIPSGNIPEKPGELLSSPLMRQVITEAREVADVVLIDTAPILAASDATHLFPLVDAVVVVARAGRTTGESARRTSELLLQLGAPVVGVALNGATEGEHLRGYYEYYSERPRRVRGRKRWSPTMAELTDRG